MAAEPDFTLYDRYGRLAAALEVKAKRGTTSRWAAEFRRNLRAYEAFRYAPFFLIVTPDRVYLWKEAPAASGPESSLVSPSFEIDAKPLFEPYLKGTRLKLEEISGPAFELVVMSWLGDLILQLPEVPLQEQLEDSGFSEAAKDGRLTYPAAA
jgi:hypothetical protein